jgi:hypothetical protein
MPINISTPWRKLYSEYHVRGMLTRPTVGVFVSCLQMEGHTQELDSTALIMSRQRAINIVFYSMRP